MLALVVFPLAGALAALHYATLGARVGLGLTVWTAWFLAVLLAAGLDTARSRDRELLRAWLVMAAGWCASMVTWTISADPLVDLTIKNLAIMAALLVVAFRPETALAALLHGVVILAAYGAARGVLPSSVARPRQFLAWSYPDIAAGLQHAALLTLGGYRPCRSLVLGWRDRRRSLADGLRSAGAAREAQGAGLTCR